MQLEHVPVIVEDYDAAITFFVAVLGVELTEDSPAQTSDGRAKRWVVVRPPGAQTGLLLARADGGGRRTPWAASSPGAVGMCLRVDDFAASFARMASAGVR
jgi:catechol 2,3-dioxygenase-like lactoylglutathione lyase family enzyme